MLVYSGAFPYPQGKPDVIPQGLRFAPCPVVPIQAEPFDYDFAFGLEASGFPAFSLRVDTRKASAAAVKLQLAEALPEKEASGQKVKGKDKKDLKEVITAKLTSQAPWLPALTDCIWNMSDARLYVSSAASKTLQTVLSLFETTFGIQPQVLTPKSDMTAIFAEICRAGEYVYHTLTPFGSASLATSRQVEEKALIAVQNNLHAVASALDEGLKIQKLRIVATAGDRPDLQFDFTLDAALAVSGLLLPRSEKGASRLDDYFLKSESCARVATTVEGLASL